MFKGTQNTNNKPYQVYTGLATFEVVAVNPDKQEIEQITGRDYPFDVNYDKRSFGENEVRPVTFYLRCIEEPTVIERITFNINEHPNKSKSGSVQFINSKGQFKWANNEDELNASGSPFIEFPFRKATEGEQELYTFMQRLIRYKPSNKDAQFLQDCEDAGITPSKIYAANFEGLQNFVAFCKEKNSRIGLVFAAKKKTENTEDGKVITKFKQTLIIKPEAFFTVYGEKVDDYQQTRLAEEVKKKDESGYPMSNDLFTIKLQAFVEEDCVNNIPTNPVVANGADDLPF